MCRCLREATMAARRMLYHSAHGLPLSLLRDLTLPGGQVEQDLQRQRGREQRAEGHPRRPPADHRQGAAPSPKARLVVSPRLTFAVPPTTTRLQVLRWVDDDLTASSGNTFCDAGCGVGSLAIPLASMGAKVSASDISSAMAGEAARRAKELVSPPLPARSPVPKGNASPFFAFSLQAASHSFYSSPRLLLRQKPKTANPCPLPNAVNHNPQTRQSLKGKVTFDTADLESLSGKYDTVTCIDVLIHYREPHPPQLHTCLSTTCSVSGLNVRLPGLSSQTVTLSQVPATNLHQRDGNQHSKHISSPTPSQPPGSPSPTT